MRLDFDEPSHTYTLDGKVLPSVTQLLKPISDYGGIPESILNKAADRGNYVHKCCEMYFMGTLDEDQIDEECAPYFHGFKKFLSETGFQIEFTEDRVYHSKLGYAGSLDMIGLLPAIKGKKKQHRALIDTKTTFRLLKSVGPQTAAYMEAWHDKYKKEFPVDARYALQLKKDGTYLLEPLTSQSDFNIFVSCLNIYNFMRG